MQALPPPLPQLPTHERNYHWIGLFVVVVMWLMLIVWAALAPMKSAVVASGKLVVESRNKVVQHLDGGIIGAILVQEGDRVEKGQVLLRLSDVQLRSNLNSLMAQWVDIETNLERLQAERNHSPILAFSADLIRRQQADPVVRGAMESQQALFESRKRSFDSSQTILQQRVVQLQEQLHGAEQLLVTDRQRAESLQQDVADLDKLYRQQMTDKVRLRELQRQLMELRGTIEARRAEIARLKSVIVENREQLTLREAEYNREIDTQIQSLQSRRSELEARRVAIEDQLDRLNIVATESGRVLGFDVVTVGSVIEPRRQIMEIVPDDHQFLMLVQVRQTDIDKVALQQPVIIKFSAFNTSLLPVMYGSVVAIAADTRLDPVTRQPQYEVKIHPDREAVALLEKQGWTLVAGMPADAYIEYSQNTMLDYLMRPFMRALWNAFNEDY